MKLSKFVKRAKSESYCVVIHADDSGIWLGTRLALYNATELPYMEGKEQAGAVLDIDSKAWEKMFFDEKYTAHAGADFGMNLTETDPTEQEARRVPLEMFYKGMGLVGLMYGNAGELIFYDSALIAPIADTVKTSDYIQTVVRKTAGGAPYVVIKDGFEVLAGFVPVKIMKLRPIRYTADFRLTYADGTVEIVEIKSKFVRRMQRDYPVRRRVFLEQIARPAGWKFTEIITAEDKDDLKRWRELAKES